MKIKLILCLCSALFAVMALGQTPAPPATTPAIAAPAATPAAAAPGAPTVTVTSPAVTVVTQPPVAAAPSIAPSPGPDNEDDFDRAVERKVRRHLNINFDGDHGRHGSDDVPWVVLPIVMIVFATPVLIVGTILYFSFSNRRAMHKTVRMLVEKGQPRTR